MSTPQSFAAPRVLLIGIDGLNFDLIERLLPADALPTVRRVVADGASGVLRSVFPTHSASAWCSFMTGQTPAGHGVFEFMRRTPAGGWTHDKPAANATLWHHLGAAGYRGGVFNFPATYPPDPINGWLVSGMLSADLQRFAAPASLAAQLLAAFPAYQLDVEWGLYAGRPAQLVQALTEMVEQRRRVAHWLLEREPLDYFAFAITATDRAQHALWQYLDPHHPLYAVEEAATLRPAIVRFYQTVDAGVASLLQCAGPETTVILLSDHGFQPVAWQLYIDDWLAQQGWLQVAHARSRLSQWLRRLDTPRVLHWRRKLFPDISRYVTTFAPGGTYDWSRTRAYNPWKFQQAVRLNLRGRDPHGIVAPGAEAEQLLHDITTALLELSHPEGGRVVQTVYRTAEMYTGDRLAEMPDLLLDIAPGFALGPHRYEHFVPTGWASADHHPDGFLAMTGAGVTPGRLDGARLIDIAPTVLQLFHLPVPASMHGKLLPGVQPTAAHQAGGTASADTASADTAPLTPAEADALRAQLRNLGYL